LANKALDDDNEDKPLDPAVERVRRRLVRFVAINLAILFVALMAVVLALVYRTRTSEPSPDVTAPPVGEIASGEIVLPAGARVLSQSLSGNRISIDAELADGGRAIFVYDMAEHRIVGRYDLRLK
jgi:hypothetical protein